MANVNLTSSGPMAGPPDHGTSVNVGVVISFILLVLAVGAYLGLSYYNSNLTKQINEAKTQYAEQIKALTSEKNLDAFDFQNRIALAKKLVENKGFELDVISNVEKSILPAVYLKSLSYKQAGKILNLSCVADSFATFVQQVANFKSSQFFSDVSTDGANVNQDGKWEFSLSLNIK